jgi:hypothetical protein
MMSQYCQPRQWPDYCYWPTSKLAELEWQYHFHLEQKNLLHVSRMALALALNQRLSSLSLRLPIASRPNGGGNND